MEVAQQADGGVSERARAVDEGRQTGIRRAQKDRAQRDADRIGEHGSVAAQVLRHLEELALMGKEAFGVNTGRPGAVAEVDGDGESAIAEVPTGRIAPGGAGLTERLDPTRRAPQPGIEHDPPPVVQAARHRLVAEDVGERDEGCERVVPPPVHEDLFRIRAADAAHHGLALDPARRRGDRLGDLFEADRRPARDEGLLVEAAADDRRRFPCEVVLEHECPHLTSSESAARLEPLGPRAT